MTNDLISRRDIKDHIGELLLVYSGAELANAILNAVDNAPTVSIDWGAVDGDRTVYVRPQGEWKHPYSTDIACECSNCHLQMPITDYFNFCPNCGADMRKGGAENETDN